MDDREENQFIVDDVSKIIKEAIESTIGGMYKFAFPQRDKIWPSPSRNSFHKKNVCFRKRISTGQSEQLDRSCGRELLDCFDQTTKTLQIYCDFYDNAEKWRWTSHG